VSFADTSHLQESDADATHESAQSEVG
jgi:hypothetical protein